MKVLTKYEQRAFEIAFDFLDRVCLLANETQEVYNIKVLHDGQAQSIPYKVATFISQLGGLKEASKFFNGYSKDKTFPRFIKKLMDNREQPRDYFCQGVLVIDTAEVQVMEYSE